MTIGIEAIGTWIPRDTVDNLARLGQFGTNREFVEEKLGFLALARKSAGQESSDLCVEAFADLCRRSDPDKRKIDCIVVCTQNPDGFGLPHTSAIVQQKLGLPEDIAAFDISLGCSGYVYGLNVVRAFMAANDFRNGLFFTADPYSKILDPEDRNTELLFGDGATCTLLSQEPEYRLLESVFATDGSGHRAIMRDGRTGILGMQGQRVFMFALKRVPEQVRRCLDKNCLTKDDIDIFLFHQGSRFIVENLRARLEIPAGKVPFCATFTGNLVSSSIPSLLQQHIGQGVQRFLLSGFGVGLSWATTIIEHV